jgi:serine phosphatase RsbU (regulator of sigma subunit)
MESNKSNQSETNSEIEIFEKRIRELETELSETKTNINIVDEIENKYEFIVNAYGEYMTLINSKYEYEMLNDSYCNTFRKKREDFIGKTVAEVWGNEKFEKELKHKLDIGLTGKIFKEEDYFDIGEDIRKYYAVSYYPYFNNKKIATHVAVVTRDITEQKEAEIELKESEERLFLSNQKKEKYLKIVNGDLEKASNYLKSLLPQETDNEILKINWKLEFSLQLGGDSFGYHWIDENHLAFYILDVTGHGVGSALHSVAALNTLKFQTLTNTDFKYPDQVLNGMNRVFQMSDHYSLFITMWYCVYNIENKILKYAGAGHPPIMLFNKENPSSLLQSQNTIIGVEKDVNFRCESKKIQEGTEMYLFTDGAFEVEAEKDKMMNVNDLMQYLSHNKSENAEELNKLFVHLLKMNRSVSLDDDFTILKLLFK